MKVTILLFGMAREAAGFGREQMELPEGSSLGALRAQYETRFPRLRELSGSLVLSVNQEVAGAEQILHDGDEIGLLPPVSGGTETVPFAIVTHPIDTAAMARALQTGDDGAVAVFEGIVRNNSRGRRTLFLEYEAYPPMALRKMEQLAEKARAQFAISRVGIVHRVGRLEIGETSVAIVVTAPHRRAALDACQFCIDRLKQIVPVWKKEYFEDGAVWAEGEGRQLELSAPRPTGRAE